MLEKISVKTITVIFLLCAVALSFCACVNPVDIDKFFTDDYVKDALKATRPTVNIYKDSDDFGNLTAGDCEISGLTSGKYYRVEEYDKNEIFIRNIFLQSDGKLNELKEIGPLTGKKIEKLTNTYWYRVKVAKTFDLGNPDDTGGTYKYFTLGGSGTDPAVASKDNDNITKLAIKILGDGKYYLDLSNKIKADKIYEVMKVQSWNDSYTSAHYKDNLYGPNTEISSINTGNYKPDFDKPIGVYQYRGEVKTGSIPLENMSIIELSISDGALSNYVFVECKTADVGSKQEVTDFYVLRVELKQTPTADDFIITGKTATYDGDPKNVTITPLDDSKSKGSITVYYDGSIDKPTDAGIYTVTFDVGESIGWAAVTGLSAGNLTIEKGTPVLADFTITGKTATYDGSSKAVTITPLDDKKSHGLITVYYDDISTEPTNAGEYIVTFDVAVSPDDNWNEVLGLEAGKLTINKLTPTIEDFTVNGFGPFDYDGTAKSVTVTIKPGKTGIGTVTVKYNGSDTEPIDVGHYAVTLDVAESTNYNSVSGLNAGTLIIKSSQTKLFDIKLAWSNLPIAPPPTYTDSSRYANANERKIIIDITTITDMSKYKNFVWYADIVNDPSTNGTLTNDNGNSKNLSLTIDANDAPEWFLPDEFTIKLIVDEQYEVIFTVTPVK